MKKLSFRLLCLCLVLMQCFCLFACSEQPADPTTLGTTGTTEATTEATTVATTEDTTPATTESGEPNYSVLESTDPIKNIILIIGDGMGLKHIEAGQLYDGKTYDFTSWPMVRINTAPLTYEGTISEDPTDSAASATAMATGNLTVSNYVGMTPDGTTLQTIMDYASAMGKATGVVTTDQLFGATPCGFSAHSRSRTNRADLLESQLTSGVNLLCGDLHEACTVLEPQIKENGYKYCSSYANLNSTFYGEKAYWQLPLAGADPGISLADVSMDAMSYLDQDPDGFVLMIEQGHIDKFSHNNEFEDTVKCVSYLNETVEAVMRWLGNRTDTAVLITADHETGSLQVSGEEGKYANTFDGPNGKISYEYRGSNHTSVNVALYVHGVTADFTKSDLYKKKALKNTGIYYLMEEILNIGKEETAGE